MCILSIQRITHIIIIICVLQASCNTHIMFHPSGVFSKNCTYCIWSATFSKPAMQTQLIQFSKCVIVYKPSIRAPYTHSCIPFTKSFKLLANYACQLQVCTSFWTRIGNAIKLFCKIRQSSQTNCPCTLCIYMHICIYIYTSLHI